MFRNAREMAFRVHFLYMIHKYSYLPIVSKETTLFNNNSQFFFIKNLIQPIHMHCIGHDHAFTIVEMIVKILITHSAYKTLN